MSYSVDIIKLLQEIEPPVRKVLIGILEEIERQRKQWEESITKTEFRELKEIVAELAAAQKQTEKRVNELAEAQKQTEKRLNELAEAQKQTEKRLNELAEAQKQTEKRVNELTEAQKQTERRLNELAEAQKQTEKALQKLAINQTRIREELDGLAHTVGYRLEDDAYRGLPSLLWKDFGIKVKELKRDFVQVSPGRWEGLNILGQGRKNRHSVWILGECKAQLKKRDIDRFLKKLSRMEGLFPGEKILVAVTYQTSPQVREYVQNKGIQLYFSYQLNQPSLLSR